MRILFTGGTGMLGKRLTTSFVTDGITCVVLSRTERPADNPLIEYIVWDGKTIPADVGPVDAVINLAGNGIADKRWSQAYKAELLSSRVQATSACVAFIQAQTDKPRVFISASAVGYYGNGDTRQVDETAPNGRDFLAMICQKWEAAAQHAGIRTVVCRIGIVLAPEGGAFPKLLAPFKYYAGGYMGNGRQGFSWVHIQDVVGMFRWAIENEAVSGPLNVTAPDLQTNKGLSMLLGKATGTRVLGGVPEFLIRTILGERALVLLEGQLAKPAKAVALGYQFHHPTAQEAIADVLANNPVQMRFNPLKVS